MEGWRSYAAVALMLVRVTGGSAFAGQGVEGAGRAASVGVISPIFHQLVEFSQPAEFDAGTTNEKTQGKSYLREVVLHGETMERWTQMLTVTGYRGLAQGTGATPERMGMTMGVGFQKACPETYAVKSIGRLTISGRPAFLELVRCGSVGDMGGAPGARHSETALIVVIAGDEDFYTLQWAERGTALETAAEFDEAKWQGRFRRLGPVRICPIVEGEKAPYPSCVGK